MRTLTTFSRLLPALCVAALLAAGCTDKEETREMDFSLSRYSVAFAVGGGTTSLTVGTSDSWSASTDAAWLTLGQSGSTLSITAEANDVTTEVREADVTVTTSSYGSATVQVRQEPAEGVSLSLSYGTAEPKIDSEGGTFTVSVNCNCDWTAALESAVEGWDLTVDATAGTVTVAAEPNSGDAITGKIVVSSSLNGDSASETVTVTQISRDENPYFSYTGYWLVDAADAYYGGAWFGQSGTYSSCSLAEYNYATSILSLVGWDGVSSLQMDRLQYSSEYNTVTIPMGFLCGSVYASYYEYYMYFVAFNEDLSSFYTGSDVVFTISDDGQSIDVSGITDEYPIIGYVGYNSYKGYARFSNIHYCKAPLSMTKSEDTTTSSVDGTSAGFSLMPVEDLPDDVPARLPKGMTGEISTVVEL